MGELITAVIVEKSRDNLVFVKEVESERTFIVTDKEAKAYRPGDLLTLDLTTKKFVNTAENYPFI
ncbi:hypothetical protein [Enterococcus mundtii]|uniref:hypothetical protein n=1 Tax=Enterococcus mundtii TaxID=53346 RepID=UPI0032E035A1